jgi:uncharacterized membrane protein
MARSAKLLGHPVHPMLVVFPLGLFATAIVFDIIRLATGGGTWSLVAYYMIAAGVIGGLIAAVFGLIDWLAIPGGTRAKHIGTLHGLGNVVVVTLFVVSWLLRRVDPSSPPALALACSFAGVALALVTGWLGGELVDRLGIGVDEGANPNAPSSLSSRSARPTAAAH